MKFVGQFNSDDGRGESYLCTSLSRWSTCRSRHQAWVAGGRRCESTHESLRTEEDIATSRHECEEWVVEEEEEEEEGQWVAVKSLQGEKDPDIFSPSCRVPSSFSFPAPHDPTHKWGVVDHGSLRCCCGRRPLVKSSSSDISMNSKAASRKERD
ncbi:hypothetical protein E2C01_021474 [Portunus trituberculatus]|uniref:Uncharacterized protein n=1 Tax=Portunus trituberculatus TaxID=210409 RepID=A0A5B7E665_PORTR|nr:hypothetical protein [Portunus trituberculatus]